MAKLKLWVRNLIIILATIICLAGVGVGVYFICKPADEEDPGKTLSPEQKEYIDAMTNAEQPDIDISHYDGLMLEDGTSISAGDIIHSFGNYVVVENKTTGLPEFFVLKNNASSDSAQGSTSSQNSSLMVEESAGSKYVTLEKITIQSDYSHLYKFSDNQYATFGDYAIVTDNAITPTIWVVSLKTGATVLENDDINFSHITSSSAELDSTYVGSYVLSVAWASDNFLMVQRQEIVAANTSLADDTADNSIALESKYILYPLDNISKKLEFDSDEPLLNFKLVDNYLYILTTKNTYVYSTQLSQDGRLQSVLTLANSFISTTQADAQVTISGLGYFKDVVYYDIQVLDGSKLLIEKRETKADLDAVDNVDGYSLVRELSDIFDSHEVGLSYLVYDVENQTYVEDVPKFSGKIEVLESFVDGYFVLNSNYQTKSSLPGYSIANIYDSNFTYVLSYRADRYGTIVAYNGECFITSGKGSSTILSPWGEDCSHHAGYNIVSTSICDDYVVVKNDKYYSLYNTKTGYVYSDTYLFISQIMNGKVLAYKENTGYCIMNLASEEKEITPIYNFDTTTTDGQYGINLYFSSVGFYFTYANETYTYVGFDGTSYTNISTYDYKIIDNQVYLSLAFKNGNSKLIVSKVLGEISTLSAEDIESDYLCNATAPATQTMAIDSNFDQTINGGGNTGGSSSGSSSESSSAKRSETVKMDGVATVKATVAEDSGVPTYTLELESDVLYGNVSDSDEYSKDLTEYDSNGAKPWTNTAVNDDKYGIGIFKGSVGYKYSDAWEKSKEYRAACSKNLHTYLDYYFKQFIGVTAPGQDGKPASVPIPISAVIADEYRSSTDKGVTYSLGGAVMIITPYYFIIVARYDVLYSLDLAPSVESIHLVFVGVTNNEPGYISEASLSYNSDTNSLAGYDQWLGLSCLSEESANGHYSTTLSYARDGYTLPTWIMESTGAGTALNGQIYGGTLNKNYIIQQYAWLGKDNKIGAFSDTDDLGEDMDSCNDKIQMDLTYTAYKSEFTRKMQDITGIDNENVTYSDSLSTLQVTKSEDDVTASDYRYSNSFEIQLNGSAFEATNFSYSWYSKSGHILWKNLEDTNSSTKISDSRLDCDHYLRHEAWDTIRYYRVQEITDISITYKTSNSALNTVYGANLEEYKGTGKSGKLQLAHYGTFTYIYQVFNTVSNTSEEKKKTTTVETDYGFIQSKDEANFYNTYEVSDGAIVDKTTALKYFIGSPRPNLSYFTYNCTFGYRLNGLKWENEKDWLIVTWSTGVHRKTTLEIIKENKNLRPSQTALTFDIKYNYLDPGDGDSDTGYDQVVKNITNSVNGSASEGTTGAYSFNATLSENGTCKLPTFKDYDAYDAASDAANNILRTPRGWTFVGWAVGYDMGDGKGCAIMYNGENGFNYETITSPVKGASGMKLAGGEGFGDAADAKQQYKYKMLENGKDGYNILKYLPHTGNDMTINSNAIKYANTNMREDTRTLNLTAIYAPKQYTFTIDVSEDTNWKEGSTLYVWSYNQKEKKYKYNEVQNDICSIDVYYNETLEIPKMYVQVGKGKDAYFYDVVLCKEDTKVTDPERRGKIDKMLNDTVTYNPVHVKTDGLTHVLKVGEDFYKYDTDNTTQNTVYFRAGLRAIEYGTTIDGTQDSHVYGNGDNGSGDYFHEDKKLITSITVSGNVNKVDKYGTEYQEEKEIYGYNNSEDDSKLVFTTPFTFISGQEYTLKIKGISYNYKVEVEFTSGDKSKAESFKRLEYYWNDVDKKNSDGVDASNVISSAAALTNASSGLSASSSPVILSASEESYLLITLGPVSGGAYGSENNEVTLTITIETAFFKSQIYVGDKDDQKALEPKPVGDISISDKANDGYHKEKNDLQDGTTYYIGAGSTILLKCTINDMDSTIHGTNYSVNNAYLSGLKIEYTGKDGKKVLFHFDATKTSDLDSTIANETLKLAQNPTTGFLKLYGLPDSGGNERGFSAVKYGDIYIFGSNTSTSETQAFIKLLYGLTDDQTNLAGSIYYTVIEVSSNADDTATQADDTKCYMIITNHVADEGETNGEYYGMRACFIYNVGENEKNVNGDTTQYNTYEFYVSYTKINSTLTFDSTLNGELQKNGETRYLTNSDSSASGDVAKTDGDGSYILIFGKKVYVNVVNNKLQVNKGKTDSDVYNYLFGTDGILKNNIDEYGYLFVYVNKPEYSKLKDAKGNIITQQQNGQDSITEDGKTYVWNGIYYVYGSLNQDTGIYWNSAESWFRKVKDNGTENGETENDVNIEEYDKNNPNNPFNFASVKPSNRFIFDIIAKKGQIAKTITIYYNSTTKYVISLSGINIDNDETMFTPVYIITKYAYGNDSGWVTDSALSLSNTTGVIEIEHMLLNIITSGSLIGGNSGFELNSIDLSANSTLLCSIDIALISASAHISVDFVDYSMVVVGEAGIGDFGYSLDAGNNQNINIVVKDGGNTESGETKSWNTITTIKFEKALNLYDGNKYTHTDGKVYYLKNNDGKRPTIIVSSCEWDGTGYVYEYKSGNKSEKYYLTDDEGNKLGEQKVGETTIEYLSIDIPKDKQNLFVSRNNNQTNIAQNVCGDGKIYFMVLGGATKAKVSSTFTEKAIYTVSINGTNAEKENPSNTYNNTAEWGDFDDEKVTTKMTIGKASGANWIASFKIGTKSISSSITSDIEFGYGDNSNILLEETLKENPNLTDGTALDGDDQLLYETGDGQVASGGTMFKANMNNNFDRLVDWNYTTLTNLSNKVKYGATAYLRGNKIAYTIATQYGYEWTDATLVIKVGINSSKINEFNNKLAVTLGEVDANGNIVKVNANGNVVLVDSKGNIVKVDANGDIVKVDANGNVKGTVILSESEESYYLQITLENLTSTNGGDIVVSYGDDKTMKIGSIEWETDSLPTLTLTLERASIDTINLDLHYDAKEFELIYNTSSDFGTSPVDVGANDDDDVDEKTGYPKRTFTYNLKQDLNTGWGTELFYNRIGYDQLGWAYGAFYKDENGKTENTTAELTKDNYVKQLYGISEQNYNWYTSLGEDYADVFGTDNNGKITMHTIWNAKTYSLILDYNDNKSENNGSTTSTKYTASWVFDMPISSADIAGENVSFADSAYSRENTLTNAISRVYRLGYTFNGWYYKDGTFNGTNGYDGLVYSAHNDNVLTTDANSFQLALTSTSGKLGYPNTITTPNQVFGYSVYQAINAAESWSEEAGETASSFNLYASWTANTYGFIYDLNGDNSVDGYTDNGYKSLKYDGTIKANEEPGVGSSSATLAFGESGVVNVAFDSNLDKVLSAYAYRKGYKFTGWYFARKDGGIAEGKELNKTLLLQLIGTADELFAIKRKVAEVFESNTTYKYGDDSYSLGDVNLIETLGTTGVTNSKDSNKNLSSLSGNAILLHAQWESLPYLVNIDLNNWNMPDYNKGDGEYMAGDEQYTGQNNTTNVQLKIYFDKKFETLELSIDGGDWLTKSDNGKFETSITRNGKEYTISGDTAYSVLLQILTAYGYTLGDGTYDFAIYGNGQGEACTDNDGKKVTVNINKDTEFRIDLYNQLVYFADKKTKNADGVNYTNCTDKINTAGALPTSGAALGSIDYSGENRGDWHKYKADDMNNSEKVGYRQFTLFAIWTIKNIYLDNIGTKEEYSNALDENSTNQTLFIKNDSGSGNKQFYNKETSTYFKNTGDDLGNIGSKTDGGSVDGYKNEYYGKNTYYLSPSTGQYFSSLTIWFNDNYLINGKYSNQTRGKLTLTFEWNKVNRKLTITSATLEIGEMRGGEFVATYTATNDDTEGLRPVISDNGQSVTVTISGEASYCFVSEIEISVSKYMLVEDVSDKNINTAYKDSEWIDRAVPDWLTGTGLKDVHYLTIAVTGQKSNLVFDGTTMGQTFDVDYYRFVRPSDDMQTYIDNEENSATYGEEVWDSEFVNDWSMYEVYKTTTYRYGEYASTTYSYATNFAFSSWYFYQGHITNYVEYGNYDNPDIIYQTHESYLIPQTVQFVWDEAESKYVFTQTLSYYLKDSDGNVISSKQGDQDTITAKCLLAYKDEEEDVTYAWNEDESKYVYTQTLTYYLKDSGDNIISSKQDGQNEITGWLRVNNDGYQCSQGQYALYDFIGEWSEPITYYWCTWEDDYGQLTGGYVTAEGLSECKAFTGKLGEGYEVLDSGRLYGYNDAHEKVELDSVTLHNYKYHDDYKDYRYDNKAIRGNVSMVAVYVPAQTRKVYYYTWKDSGSTSSGYEERTDTSNEYVLGVKHNATIKDVVTTTGTTTGTTTYNHIKYWELGTNNKYYRVGFSGFNSFDASGNPTVTSALAFLMQFVNKDNFGDYPTDVGGNVTIAYSELVDIINKLGYGKMETAENNDVTDVVTLAVNLYKALLKRTDSYKAYKYLQQSDVALNLGLDITQDDINSNKLKALALLSGITIKEDDLNNSEITIKEDDLNNAATILTLYEKALKTTLNEQDVKNLLNKDSNAIDDIMNSLAGEIIDNLTAEQLAVVLDKISMDYFGYVLINPSENIGYWPSGTYLAGWYMVPEPLRQALITAGSAVLTFDSDNFVEGGLQCYKIISQQKDPSGNITYQVQYNNGAIYEVTRFNVFDEKQIDILSRVETSVHIFAAYNTIKFEIADLEYLKDELDNKVTTPKDDKGQLVESYTKDGIVYTWDGTGYAYYKVEYLKDDSGKIIETQQKDASGNLLDKITKNITLEDGTETSKTYIWNSDVKRYIFKKANQGKVEGHLGIDIKYAHKEVTNPYTGDPYLYTADDVRYVVLKSNVVLNDKDPMSALAEAFKLNTNIPTSLQTIINTYGLDVYESLDDATKNAQIGDTIVAFVYNLVSCNKDGTGGLSKDYGDDAKINNFATTCCYVDSDGMYLCDLIERLNAIYDEKSRQLYD